MTNFKDYIGMKDLKLWDGITRTFARLTSTGGSLASNKFGEAVNVLEVYGAGTAYNDTTLNTAISAIGSNVCEIVLTPGTWTISNNVTIPANIALRLPKGAIMAVDSGKTLTINGDFIDTARTQKFSGAGTVTIPRTIYPEWWGATGNGTTDDTLSLYRMALGITNNNTISFAQNATYLISQGDAGNENDYGKSVIFINGKTNVKMLGNGATIKIVSHNIGTYGGLLFLKATGCPKIEVCGFNFDMTFTGQNLLSTKYPFNGAIYLSDPATGAHTQTDLNGTVVIKDNIFKIFHPLGQWATTNTVGYDGDTNNGFKIYSIFVSGDYLATTFATQNRGVTIESNTFLDGHNAYGIWVWAYNDVKIFKNSAHGYVGKYSTYAGAFGGIGVPFIRYITFYQTGLLIDGNIMYCKPSVERVSGFEGKASMIYVVTNLSGASYQLTKGNIVVAHNQMIGASSDTVNAVSDEFILTSTFGEHTISDNIIDGESVVLSTGTVFVIGQGNSYGKASYTIKANAIGANHGGMIFSLTSHGSSHAERKIKSIIITDNTIQSFKTKVVEFSNGTYNGVERFLFSHNSISNDNTGTVISYPTSGTTDAGDIYVMRNNIIKKVNNLTANGVTVGQYTTDENYLYTIATSSAQINAFDNNKARNLTGTARFSATQAVTVASGAGYGYTYTYTEYDAAGVVVTSVAGYNFGVTTLATVGAGNNGVLFWQKVGSHTE